MARCALSGHPTTAIYSELLVDAFHAFLLSISLSKSIICVGTYGVRASCVRLLQEPACVKRLVGEMRAERESPDQWRSAFHVVGLSRQRMNRTRFLSAHFWKLEHVCVGFLLLTLADGAESLAENAH